MTTELASSVHDEAIEIVREAVKEYLPIARVRRIELDTQTWEQVISEVRDVVAQTK
jgi:SepF-like predicted cell division protein (DUF552 family)